MNKEDDKLARDRPDTLRETAVTGLIVQLQDRMEDHASKLAAHIADEEASDKRRKKFEKKVVKLLAEREAARIGAKLLSWLAVIGTAALSLWAFLHGTPAPPK